MTVKFQRMGPGTLHLGTPGTQSGTSYSFKMEVQVTECSFDAGAKVGDPVTTLSGDIVPGDYSEAPTLKGKMLSDWNQTYASDASGFTTPMLQWLIANRGKICPFEFNPNPGSGSSDMAISGTLVIQPAVVGGTVGSSEPVDFSFSVADYDLTAAV